MKQEKTTSKMETIVLGGGCFWCTEAVYKRIKGVISVMPGYAGGTTQNPTSEDVYSGKTGHAEVVEIIYDPDALDLPTLLDIFFTAHDPTTHNRQGNDVGSEYRSMILYTTEQQKKIAQEVIKDQQKNFDKPIVTEIRKLDIFYKAENYHLDYYAKNPLQPYCMLVIHPKLAKVKKKFEKLLK